MHSLVVYLRRRRAKMLSLVTLVLRHARIFMAVRGLRWLCSPAMQALDLIALQSPVNAARFCVLDGLGRFCSLTRPHALVSIRWLLSLLMLLGRMLVIVALAVSVRLHLWLLFDAPDFGVVPSLAAAA